ncbi:hypothetical protein [Mycolicibacterium sp.]|uniref:hypothetical protein n=1 Tax=Mycolicibacterium sp. TaxID=2320850 RepID=UPI0037CABEB3
MSIFGNLSDLAHEIRSGVGTVLTILGSKLEADARARVECGPQWLTEFEEQRDSLEPADMCQFHGEWCAGEASWCTRQCNKCDEAVYWHRDVEAWFHCAGVLDRRPCPYGDGPVVEHSSAAVSAAADPSPTVPNAHSVVGDCPGSDSVILPTVEPGPQTAVETGHDMGLNWACEMFPQHQKHAPSRADASAPPAVSAQTCSSDGRADAVAIAESVTHEDLYMHLVRAAHRANTGHVDVLIEEFTNSLLTDFNITPK